MKKGKQSIADSVLDGIYRETFDVLSELYVEGTFQYIEENYPDLDREMTITDENINRIWPLCLQDLDTLENFKKAVNYYKNLIITSLRIWEKDICEEEQTLNKILQKN